MLGVVRTQKFPMIISLAGLVAVVLHVDLDFAPGHVFSDTSTLLFVGKTF